MATLGFLEVFWMVKNPWQNLEPQARLACVLPDETEFTEEKKENGANKETTAVSRIARDEPKLVARFRARRFSLWETISHIECH